jgi:tetratricopeptide (TPR) repeat protein
MNLADERLKELDAPSLTSNQRTLLRCRLASEFAHRGQYDAAREALGHLWQGLGQRPNTEGMEQAIAAEVLLQVGTLSGWIGASRQTAGAQEKAKDLISEGAEAFERVGQPERAAAARAALALCYWRTGAYDEAGVLLEQAHPMVNDHELKARIISRLVVVESSAGHYTDALRLLTEHATLFETVPNQALRGKFHNELAIVFQLLATAERRTDYYDKAIIEYTAAIYHCRQGGHERYAASIENNLAFLLYKIGRYEQAHEHLDQTRRIIVQLNDAGLLAQVDETRARVFIAEKKYREANKAIAGTIQTLERGGESALLADALTVQGIAWARLGVHESSINILRRAMSVAEMVGALPNAGLAALTLIEEHGARRLSHGELYSLYSSADRLLKSTQDAEDLARLRTCARIALRRLSGAKVGDKGFSLYKELHDLEAKYIEQALADCDRSVTRAADKLGVAYQTLVSLLNSRHKPLLKLRTPPRRRRRRIIKNPD